MLELMPVRGRNGKMVNCKRKGAYSLKIRSRVIAGVGENSKIHGLGYKLDSHATNLFQEVGGVGLLYLRCSEKHGNFLGEGATFRGWVGKCAGYDGDDLDLLLHFGEGVGVLLNMIHSRMLLDFEVLQ